MHCEICHQKVKTKRHFGNLFSCEIHHICEYCFMQYPIIPRYQVIPIQGGLLHHHTLLRCQKHESPRAYMSFLGPYYLDFIKNHQGKTFLYYDELNEMDVYQLDLLELGDLVVLSLYENIK
ncbi:MAG: hypothetical protein IH571_03850 [Acholeplasmataceae bacterium]|nr:hypothetical protein [Acholeplasmataceae bacterium]